MKAVVVGGGLAGLFVASELAASGVDDLIVLERESRPGGVATTRTSQGFSLELGVGSFSLPHPDLGAILERSGVPLEPLSGPSTRYVFTGGELVAFDGPRSVVRTPTVSMRAKAKAVASSLLARPETGNDESLSVYLERRLGAEAGGHLAWLMAAGVFAGDPDVLSARAAFPRLTAFTSGGGSLGAGVVKAARRVDRAAPKKLYAPKGGMSDLAGCIASGFGDRFQGGQEVRRIDRSDGRWMVETATDAFDADIVAVCLPPTQAGPMFDGELREHLRDRPVAEVAVVGLGGLGPSPAPDGYGVIIGRDASMATLGVQFESSQAPWRAPEGSWMLRAIVGGSARPEITRLPDIGERVTAELETVFGSSVEPTWLDVHRTSGGIPQYEIGHTDWLAELDRLTSERPGLYLGGWGYRGPGAANLASDAVDIARKMAGYRQ